MVNIKEVLKRNAAIVVFFIVLAIYAISAGVKLNQQSKTPQYIYLANSFLHGHVDLITLPESTFDLISYQGKWYVPGGMMPAILLIPFVAFFGSSISDVLYGVILGALNVSLMYALLSQVVTSYKIRLWLTSLFGFGTVHWWVASVGSVWFNAHLAGILFSILFVLSTLQNKPFQAGVFFCCAAFARPPILFSALFYVTYTYLTKKNKRDYLKRLVLFGTILSSGVVIMFTYNYLRFKNPIDFGYGYVRGTAALTSAYAKGGGFNITYMPCNIYVSIFGAPNVEWNPLPPINQVCTHLKSIAATFGKLSDFFNPVGMSVFLTTPVFLLLFTSKLEDKLVLSSLAGISITLPILWMYHTTGWTQFGYRYILDIIVYIFLILGVTIKNFSWRERILSIPSYIMGAIGVYLMYYLTFGLIWYEPVIQIVKKIYRFFF